MVGVIMRKMLNLIIAACVFALTQGCNDSPPMPQPPKPQVDEPSDLTPPPAPSDPSERFVPIKDSAQVKQTNCPEPPIRRNPCLKDMILVECGTFVMGAISGRDEIENKRGIITTELDESSRFYKWEVPAHNVTVFDFCIDMHEVTQKKWKEIMEIDIHEHASARTSRPLAHVQDDYPMYYVNWYEASEYAKKFGEKFNKKCRLPTEAEWEYAARGGKHSKGYTYPGSDNITLVAWHDANNNGFAQVPCQKGKNELGLCDMSGNMFEWVDNWYGQYTPEDKINPRGPDKGSSKILRGGGWHNFEYFCRSAFRGSYAPGSSEDYIGFRIACEA